MYYCKSTWALTSILFSLSRAHLPDLTYINNAFSFHKPRKCFNFFLTLDSWVYNSLLTFESLPITLLNHEVTPSGFSDMVDFQKQLAIWGSFIWDAGKKFPFQSFCSGLFQKSFPLKQPAVDTLYVRSLELQTLPSLWTFSLYYYCDKSLWITLGENYSKAVGLHWKLYPYLISASSFFLYIHFMRNLVFSTEGCE